LKPHHRTAQQESGRTGHQPAPPLADYNVFETDRVMSEAVRRGRRLGRREDHRRRRDLRPR
jgi:hypothetical protein